MIDLDLDEAPAPDDGALKRVADLAGKQLQLTEALAAVEAEAKRLNGELRLVAEVELPQAMTDVGLTEFKLADGSRVGIDVKTSASIPKAREAEAFAWLEEHGYANIIKHQVTVSFARDEDPLAKNLLAFVKAELPEQPVVDKRAVAPQTLGLFVRERLAEGDDLPQDLLGVFTLRRAVIVKPKEK